MNGSQPQLLQIALDPGDVVLEYVNSHTYPTHYGIMKSVQDARQSLADRRYLPLYPEQIHDLVNGGGLLLGAVMTKEISLTKGFVAIVDDEDFEWLNNYTWAYCTNGYTTTTVYRKKKVYMHRMIMGDGNEIDHVNGNRLDNRRSNLRFCTHAENCRNSSIRSDNTSGYVGVSFDKSRNKWEAYINLDGNRRHLGRFETPGEAAFAYDRAAKELHGEFAYLNFKS